jgi:hypothetical protein
MKRGGHNVTRAQFEQNLEAKLGDPQFNADIGPLLAQGYEWDAKKGRRHRPLSFDFAAGVGTRQQASNRMCVKPCAHLQALTRPSMACAISGQLSAARSRLI